MENFVVRRGRGQMNYVLGQGASGTAGHVELALQTLPTPGEFSVQWRVAEANFAADARQRIEEYARSYLKNYLADEPQFGLEVSIVAVTSDAIRHNDYERAVYWALHGALEEAQLPVPQIFAAPEEDEN